MTKEEKKRYVIKNTLSPKEMEEAEIGFMKEDKPFLSIAEALKQANKKDLVKSA